MATVTFVAQSGQPSNRGQSVLITLSQLDIEDNLPLISVGNLATVFNSSNIGYISKIDKAGGTFTIKPKYPMGDLSSYAGSSIMVAGEEINVTT